MFKLDVPTRITKELLLSKHPQEEYFEFYLGVPVKKGLFCCPSIIRTDHKPTCSFYKDNKGGLKFKDFAGPSFDFIGCVMHIYNCNYYHALRIIANDFGIIEVKNVEKHIPLLKYTGVELEQTDKAIIQVEIKAFSPKELLWWESFGISINTLKKYKVYSIKSVFLNGNYFTTSTETCPIYGYYGGENSDGNELWRLYMPTKKKYRFLSNWSSTIIQGSKQIPKEGDYIVITKSLKDVILLHEFGFTSIAPNSENTLLSEAQIKKISSRFNSNLIYFFDNDLAGVKGAHKYKKKYTCRCIFIKRSYAKDISDLYKKLSITQFWEVVDELHQITQDFTIKKTKHFYIF